MPSSARPIASVAHNCGTVEGRPIQGIRGLLLPPYGLALCLSPQSKASFGADTRNNGLHERCGRGQNRNPRGRYRRPAQPNTNVVGYIDSGAGEIR